MRAIADVLEEHELAIDYPEYFICSCSAVGLTTNGSHADHQATALSAAGFGLVLEERAKFAAGVQKLAAAILDEDIMESLEALDTLAKGDMTPITALGANA